jgi:hypothetical protein
MLSCLDNKYSHFNCDFDKATGAQALRPYIIVLILMEMTISVILAG